MNGRREFFKNLWGEKLHSSCTLELQNYRNDAHAGANNVIKNIGQKLVEKSFFSFQYNCVICSKTLLQSHLLVPVYGSPFHTLLVSSGYGYGYMGYGIYKPYLLGQAYGSPFCTLVFFTGLSNEKTLIFPWGQMRWGHLRCDSGLLVAFECILGFALVMRRI